MLTLLEGAV